ncbi:MFS transporter [Streptomyces sp. NPDC055815]
MSQTHARGQQRHLRRVVTASFVGTAVEWYDYFIYGTAAALVFGPQFFPQFSPAAGTLASFATYTVGFLARPLGGVVMGHFGDRIGRKAMLVLSLTMMGLATTCIGLLPSYEAIGIWAPVLLVLLRLIQGLGVGGEWGGAALMAVEHAPPGKRGFYGGFPQMGVPGGLILANVVFLAVSNVAGPSAFAEWGWRIPFLASFLLVGVGLLIRLKVDESPEFSRAATGGRAPAGMPVVEVLRTQWKDVLLAGGTFIGNNAFGYIFMAYTLSYATAGLGFSRDTVLVLVLAAAAVWLVSIPWAAALSDRFGRRRVILAGSAALVVWAVVYFPLLDTASTGLALSALGGLGIILGFTYGPQAALFSELFEARLRYSGISLGYQVGAVLGGGLAPIIATALYDSAHASRPITLYLVGICGASLICVLLLTRGSSRAVTQEGLPGAVVGESP